MDELHEAPKALAVRDLKQLRAEPIAQLEGDTLLVGVVGYPNLVHLGAEVDDFFSHARSFHKERNIIIHYFINKSIAPHNSHGTLET